MSSCVINMKGMAITKARRQKSTLGTLKRKGKIIPKLVLEENSNIRSNMITVGLFSFLISISNMENSERDKDTTLGHLYAASSNVGR